MSAVLLPLLLVLGVVGGLVAAIAAIRSVGARRGWSPEVSRKAVHVVTGLVAMTFPVTFPQRWPVAVLILSSVGVMAWLRSPSQRDTGLGVTLHAVERRSWGDVLLALTIGFLFFRSPGQPILYVLPLAIVTLSDSAAALAGSAYGRQVFKVASATKSVEGCAVFALVSWLVAMVLLLLLTDVSRPDVILVGLLVAAFGTVVEADSWFGLDNLFVPVGVHLLLRAALVTGAAGLGWTALAFAAVVSLGTVLGRRIWKTGHALRVHAIVVFVIVAYAGPSTAVLPAIAAVAHLFASRSRPCRSRYPDLDFAAAVAGAGCLWIFVGEGMGPPSADFFSMTFAGVALAYLTLATGMGVGATALVGAALLLVLWTTLHDPTLTPTWPWSPLAAGAASLAVVGAFVHLRPDLTDRWRSPRTVALASAVPLTTFLALATLR